MRSLSITVGIGVVLACALVAAGGALRAAPDTSAGAGESEALTVQPVSGTGVHFVTTAIVHSTESTSTGMIQRSTETVDLTGDLTGRILYQPTSIFDSSAGTLVNTGHQVFSGTVLGSAPVMLYDDEFRFDVNLKTGAAVGTVHLTDSIAGPGVRCDLTVTSTGMTAEGNIMAQYTGLCRFKNK